MELSSRICDKIDRRVFRHRNKTVKPLLSVLWSVASVHLCQVSGCGPEACPGDVVIDVVVEGA